MSSELREKGSGTPKHEWSEHELDETRGTVGNHREPETEKSKPSVADAVKNFQCNAEHVAAPKSISAPCPLSESEERSETSNV